MIKRKTFCRVCKSKDLKQLWNFGPSPLANSFSKDTNGEMFYPLIVNGCENCGNVQLAHVVDPKTLFDKYLYVSSTSPVFVKHFQDFADSMPQVKSVVDIGSNDGILLKPFKDRGCAVLGIEPCKKIADKANKNGIPTVAKYFTPKLADKIGKADLITATNVFAHIDDLDSVLVGVRKMMHKNSVFVIENPYLVKQLETKSFDLTYHEHLQYWLLGPLQRLYNDHKLYITKIELTDVHGGSIRVHAMKTGPVIEFIEPDIDEVAQLQREVEKNRLALITMLSGIRGKVIGYGAPAKATTLLNYFGIKLDYVVDDSPLKQGRFIPGTGIPIVKDIGNPNYILILAWNFADSIIKKCREKGYKGKFIIPCPKPKIV